jgi:hypothetical protein
MEPRKSVNLPDGIVRSVLTYGGLQLARKMFGDDHPYVQNRVVRAIVRFVRNMSGMIRAYRKLATMENLNLESTKYLTPRMFYCLYPKQHVPTWHQTSTEWKRAILHRYLYPHDFNRAFTRIDLFRLQRRMRSYEIFAIGW